MWTTSKASDVVEYIRIDAQQLWDRPRFNAINVKNGLVEIETGELKAHNPDFLSSIQLPVKFDPNATCPAWERFIHEAFPADVVELGWEIFGYLMVPDTSIQKSTILLLGEGGNGKSVYLQGVIAFLGRENTYSATLQKIADNRFTVAQLEGRLVNVCADLPHKALRDAGMFKALTGGDTIEAERKYQPPFTFKPFARLIFSANSLPPVTDSSDGFFDRWLIVPFDQTFRGSDGEIPREELDARLSDPREQSGLLNKALEALRRLRRNNHFTESQTTRAAFDEFRQTTDSFALYLEKHTIPQPDGTAFCDDFRSDYNSYARNEKMPSLSDSQLGQKVAKHRPGVTKEKRGPKGEQRPCYIGFVLKRVV